jgi:hypothetical protein
MSARQRLDIENTSSTLPASWLLERASDRVRLFATMIGNSVEELEKQDLRTLAMCLDDVWQDIEAARTQLGMSDDGQ